MNLNKQDRGCRMGRRRLFKIPLIIAFVLIKSGLVFLIWNDLVPELFHGPTLTYLQSVELMILAKLLTGFGGFRGGPRGGPFGRGRWMRFSPEERAKLREEMHRRHEGSSTME